MPLPYYVSPEQMMKDKAEYARKGISRGKAIVTIEYRDGVLLVAENPSTLLHKISEIYDRIAFAGVGKYNEFENMRVAGVRHADVKGYSYSRGRRQRQVARQRLLAGPRQHLHPGHQAVRDRGAGGRGGRRQRHQERDLPHPLRRHDRGREELRRDGRPVRGDPPLPQGQLPGEPRPRRRPQAGRPGPDGHPEQDPDRARPRGGRPRPHQGAPQVPAHPAPRCSTSSWSTPPRAPRPNPCPSAAPLLP